MATHALEGVYLLNLRLLERTVAVSDGALHALRDSATVHAAHGDAAGVVGVVERRDEHLRRTFKLFGLGDNLHNLVEQVVDVVRGRIVVLAHPAVLGRTVNHGEIKLLLRGVEVAHEVEHHFVHLFGAAVGLVHLVHHHDGLQTNLQSLLQHEARLRHWPFESVDEEQAAVGHVEHAFHLTAEVAVARSVDDVDFRVLVANGNVLREDGYAALAFKVVVVENEFAGVLVLAKKVSCQKHLVHERRLAVVYVRNDGNVANVLHK